MPSKILIGSFVFRDEGDGCLTSKYINTFQTEPYVECSKRVESSVEGHENGNEPFVGNYLTTWIEENQKIENGTLEISKTNSSYKLAWKNGVKDLFKGTGMLSGNLLVGTYWE